jgi:O-antigen ligase/Tfp pilus assembly protein PilF
MDSSLHRLLRGSLLALFVLVPLAIFYQAFFPTLVKDVLFVGVIALCSLGWLWITILEEHYVIPVSALNLVLAGNLLVWVASLAASAYPGEGIAPLSARLAGIGLLLLAPAMLSTKRHLGWAVGLAVGAAALMSIYGVLQFFRIDPFVRTEGLVGHFRVSSTTDHPNIFVSFLVAVVPLNLAAFTLARTRGRLSALLAGALLLNLGAAAATLSRAGWAALVAALVVYGLSLWLAKPAAEKTTEAAAGAVPAPRRGGILKVALPLAIVAALGLVVLGRGFMDPGERERLTSLHGPTTQRRLLIYEAALAMAGGAPLLGQGLGTFSLNLPAYRRPELARFFHRNDYQVEHAVSEPLEVLAESGSLGLLGWILLVGAFLARPLGALRRTSDPALRAILAATAAGVAGLALHGLVEVNLRFEPPLFMFFALPGLALATEAIAGACSAPRRALAIPSWPGRLVFSVGFGMTFGLAFAAAVSDFVASSYVTLGRRALEQGQVQAAERSFRSALAAWSGNLPARYRHAYALWKLGNLAGAEAEYREVVRRSPSYFDVNHNLARLLLEEGRASEARRFAERAVQLNPYHVRSNELWVQLALREGHVSEAERAAERLLEVAGDDAGSRVAMARVRLVQGRRDEARRLLLEAARRDPARKEIRHLLGQLGP